MGVTRLHKVHYKYIRGSVRVVDVAHKLEENRLRWLGYIVRREQEHLTRVVYGL